MVSGRQALAAAGAATGDDLLAILGGHAGAPAVAALAHEAARLECALHRVVPLGLETERAWIGEGAATVNRAGQMFVVWTSLSTAALPPHPTLSPGGEGF